MNKCKTDLEFTLGLIAYHDTPLGDKVPGPAELLFGRRLNSRLSPLMTPSTLTTEQKMELNQRRSAHLNPSGTQPSLTPKQPIWIQDPASKKWYPGTAQHPDDAPHSWWVHDDSSHGCVRRNLHDIRPRQVKPPAGHGCVRRNLHDICPCQVKPPAAEMPYTESGPEMASPVLTPEPTPTPPAPLAPDCTPSSQPLGIRTRSGRVHHLDLSYLSSTKVPTSSPALEKKEENDPEFNKDLTLWLCLDQMAFHSVDKPGFAYFMEKHLPQKHIPDPNTLQKISLLDVYVDIKNALKKDLVDVKTLNVKSELASILPECTSLKDFKLYTTHDGAKNMFKASEKLTSEEPQHCVSHALHLLLMTDAIGKVGGLLALLEQCKRIVRTLHFKGSLLE
ncbi:hypothetical protein CAPTEDRAFT_186136 [Capitella teleta]|uniref:Uncharacterized protein n=1 Tax=Capitella teleta TaxID=283909 RepID=R7UC66_CAPTE|nr:hypothetical protein CAPTEDRAFT_186136 [Capitella teleta]|eukprot:ELU03584.1 hypothetical protein CAPTEDRAFT_186136 [Capitella teleta]